KLCKKDGSKVKYPMRELPDDTVWGEDKWSRDYRDRNKENCYESGTSPCKTACPAHIAVQGYIQMAKEGRYKEAVKLIRQDNPFPAVCGAVCNKRCEDRCTRGTIDRPVAIDEIKKFLAQWELQNPQEYTEISENAEGKQWTDFKIAVIGAGPAGLSAAWYLRKEGYPVTVFEKTEKPGGMLVHGIPDFRLEKSVIEKEIEIIEKMGAEIRCGVEVGKDVSIEDLRKQGYKAFLIAIGLQGGRMAGVPGEDAKGVLSGVDFLRSGTKKLEGDVVVVGGGNVAVDIARTAVRCTEGKVSMVCLEQRDEMPAAKDEVREAEEEKIEVLNGWGPKEVVKDASGKVCEVVFKKCTRVFDEEHRFSPLYNENETKTLPCTTVIMAIGQSALWGSMLEGTKVELRRNGTAVCDPVTLQTAEPDIFVAGDIAHGARFAIDAIAEGRTAMVSINRYVHPGQDMKIGRDLRTFVELDRDDIKIDSYDNAPRQAPGLKKGDAVKTFSDLRLPFTEEQVKKEASRCLKCGATFVDLNQCIGCGLCTTRCEFDAIHLTRDIPAASDMHTAEEMMKLVAPYAIKRMGKIIKHKVTGKHSYPVEQE
nr:FAD-dependent oxidoreductase [Sphaerochaetaceae bacterium]